MATHRIPILGPGTMPDDGVYPSPIRLQLTMGTGPGNELCYVMPEPAGGGDLGLSGKFSVPKDYVGSPVLVVRGIMDGAVDTNDVHFGVQMLGLADNEAYDAALEAEDTATFQSNTYADEDVFEETITLTVTLAVDDDVAYHFYIDDSGATPWTGNVLLTGLYFQYSDA